MAAPHNAFHAGSRTFAHAGHAAHAFAGHTAARSEHALAHGSGAASHRRAATEAHAHTQAQLRLHGAPGMIPHTAAHEMHGAQQHAGAARSEKRAEVPKAHSLANPRRVERVGRQSHPRITSYAAHPLAYRAGAEHPRAGKPGTGRAGAIDPGGYIRTPQAGTRTIGRDAINRQISSMSGYSQAYSHNHANFAARFGSWPGQWNPVPGWQTLGGLWNWTGLGYYNGYWWNGSLYPYNYYALNSFCPTPFLFDVASGMFLDPGVGYFDFLPAGYDAPITVAVWEVVPEYDFWGNIIGYTREKFYYDAVFDPGAQAYGYYDYRGTFHWLTFPWLHSWMGECMP